MIALMTTITEQIQTKMAEAVTAQEAGDYATALLKARSARMLAASLPDIGFEGGDNKRWDRASISAVITDLKKQLNAAAGIRKTNLTVAAITDEADND